MTASNDVVVSMHRLWNNMCRFAEDRSRVVMIAVLLTMALWSSTRIITDVAESSPTSSFGPFQSFLILGLSWWAGFATSSLPLRLAGWLGGVAAILVVDVHRFAQVSADPVWWSEWQWLIFWSHCGTLFLEASAAFSTFLLCRHIPWSGGIRVGRVDCGSSDSRGAGAERRWGIALDFLILGAVVSAIAFLLDEMMPLVWWPGSNAFKGIALVSAGTWALGITSGAASAIVVMAVAWLLLGQGRFLNKMAVVVVGCFVYLAQTLWILHPALCESLFFSWFVELAKLSAVSVLVFALLRFGGYRLAWSTPERGELGSKKAPVKTGGE